MSTFKKYETASKFAHARAVSSGIPQGIEYIKYDKVWKVCFLPKKKHRSGYELRMEQIEPPSFYKGISK